MKSCHLIILALFLCSRAFSIQLLVSNTNDSGAGSLRSAIATNTALGGGNTIVFSNTVNGTIFLTSGQLFIATNVTILGPGPGVLAINGNAIGRIFETDLRTTVFISGLTLTNASFVGGSGGAINNARSTLTVSNCTISGNSAQNGGAIYNDHGSGSATLIVKACTLSNNVARYGGAIYNNALSLGSALLSITDSTISSNFANYGGGIYNDARANGTAPIAITNCTLSRNIADYDGFFGGGLGGGIYNNGSQQGDATVSMVKSTFHGNSAQDGGGIYNDTDQGTTRLSVGSCTFSGNAALGSAVLSCAGGPFSGIVQINASTFSGNISDIDFPTIYNEGSNLQIGDSIFHSPGSGTNIFNDAQGSVVSLGYNLCSDDGSGYFTATGDQINTDPMLGPLQGNGGGTLTHALLAGSPAIDRGKRDAVASLSLTTDQRGVARPLDYPAIPNASGGDGSDIGAFEFNSPTLAIQKANTNAVLSWPSFLGAFTLETSTNIANTNGWSVAGGVATLAGNEYRQTNGPISGVRFFRLRGN